MAEGRQLTHVDREGKSRMVDVTDKKETVREAVASGSVLMNLDTLDLILAKEIKKGEVLGTARIAGIMAAKKTGELIPLCHPLNITAIDLLLTPDREKRKVDIEARVKIVGKTGVEMEALTAASVAALTIYDMCKAYDREMVISEIKLIRKSGGKSGLFIRKSET